MAAGRRGAGREVARFAIVGAVAVLLVVWLDVQARGNGNPLSLLDPGRRGPSAAVIHADFPEVRLPDGLGHDGQQFYAVARDPFPLDRSAPHLDRPQYRMQRPLLPLLAWALHPQGGGVGLVVALLATGLAGVIVGGIALGVLVRRSGGPAWSALLFACLPGTFVSLRITTADALAVALGLAAIAALDSRRWWLSVPLAIGAVLAKEPTLLMLATFSLARRDRRSVVMVAASAVAGLAWALAVRASVPATGEQVIEFVAPFTGWWAAAGDWFAGEDPVAAITSLATLAISIVAVVRHPRSVWTVPIVTQVAFLSVLGKSVVGLDYNGTRMTMPLLALGLISLLDRRAQPVRALNWRLRQGGSGTVGPAAMSGGSSNR